MSDKKGPPGPKSESLSPPSADAERTGVAPPPLARRRFSDGESTVIMPLAEILRARTVQQERPPAAPSADSDGGFGSQSTVVMRNPLPPRRPDGTKAPGGAAAPARPGPAPAPVPVPAQPSPGPDPKAPAGHEALGVPTPSPPEEPGPQGLLAQLNGGDAQQPPLPPSVPSGQHNVLMFFSCKGGSGATSLALNVAAFSAQSKRATCLVDMDLQFGDILAGLGLTPGLTIAGALAIAHKGETVSAPQLARHASGVSVLSQSGSLDDLDQVHSDQLGGLIDNLRRSFDMVVLDGLRDFSDNALAVLDMADQIALVVTQEVLSVRRARAAFGILRKIGLDPADILVVVNQARDSAEIGASTLRTIFAPAELLLVPDHRAGVQSSLDHGVPFLLQNPNHPVARAMVRVGARLLGMPAPQEEAAAPAPKTGFWARRGKGAPK